jgi:hypothetical protein
VAITAAPTWTVRYALGIRQRQALRGVGPGGLVVAEPIELQIGEFTEDLDGDPGIETIQVGQNLLSPGDAVDR